VTDALIVTTTVDSEDLAVKIASGLLERHLAACVNIVSPVRSIYRWKGQVHDDREKVLMIKTMARKFREVRDYIREVHTYELPEIIAYQVAAADENVLEWITDSVKEPPQ
jgi:periplasmic divalent cation tolerance protein